jgi:hypothetical protein
MSISENKMPLEQAFYLSEHPSLSNHLLHLVRWPTTTLKQTPRFSRIGRGTAIRPMNWGQGPRCKAKRQECLLLVKIEVHCYKDGPNTFKWTLQITLQQISPIMGTSMACAIGPSVITSSTDSSFQNLFFGIYLNYQQQKSLKNQYIPHSESKSTK